MEVVDAHMHLWDFESGNYPWLSENLAGGEKMIGNYDSIKKNYFPDDYNKDIKNTSVSKCVHIQVFGYPNNPSQETVWLQKLSEKHRIPNAIVGYVDLQDENIENEINKHLKCDNFRGIRNVLSYHSGDEDLRMINDRKIMSSPSWLNGFSFLDKHNLSFDVQIFDEQIDDLIAVADRFKNVPIIINHLAWPTDLSTKGFENWKSRIKQASSLPNIHIKISGFGCVFKSISSDVISPYISTCIEFFGVDRCMWGSNFPVESIFSSYSKSLDSVVESISSLSEDDKSKVMKLNAENFYKI
jgi:predicted TIM-barrel fold metal-dependent hydrolase|tara:strand:- start:46270 stop:47166 length:897 start_codon:yes stop_codon:yes gene_type:complete